jgi:hypothetical protein
VQVGEAVETTTGEHRRDAGGFGLRLPGCGWVRLELPSSLHPALTATTAGPLAADLGEPVGVDPWWARLPVRQDQDGVDVAIVFIIGNKNLSGSRIKRKSKIYRKYRTKFKIIQIIF